MHKAFLTAFSILRSDNLKSKIQNRKWAGLFAIVVALTIVRGEGRGAAAEESPADRVSIVGRSS